MELSIAIPAYMEEENLRLLIPRIKQTLDELNLNYEVLIIDVRSPKDHTKELCLEMDVNYITRTGGDDYGDAVRTGIETAKGNYIVFMDADGSHSPEFIKKLYASRDTYDMVIASRYVNGGGSDNTKVLIFMSWIVNFIYSVFFNLKIKDVSNSFKLYRADQLKQIKLSSKNFDIVEEIIIKMKRRNNNLNVLEIPYLFKERMFGRTKRNLFVFTLSYIFTLVKLKFSK